MTTKKCCDRCLSLKKYERGVFEACANQSCSCHTKECHQPKPEVPKCGGCIDAGEMYCLIHGYSNYKPSPASNEVKCEHDWNKDKNGYCTNCKKCGVRHEIKGDHLIHRGINVNSPWAENPASTEAKCDGSCKLSLDKQTHFHDSSISGVYPPASTEEWKKKYLKIVSGVCCDGKGVIESFNFVKDLLFSHDQQLRQRIVEWAENTAIDKQIFPGNYNAEVINKSDLLTFITNL